MSLITFALGLLIELLQALFTHGHRHFDLNDIYFNLIGIALGLAVLLVYKGKRA
ncbi:MAG: VanZ family protein [Salinivirgaceae bacterium]|nr:VanZ family protein [Salinivirgaceae bacterium]